jgi:hypothetical protein
MFSVAKHVIMDNGEVDTIGFAIDKEIQPVLRVKNDVILIDEDSNLQIQFTFKGVSNIQRCTA